MRYWPLVGPTYSRRISRVRVPRRSVSVRGLVAEERIGRGEIFPDEFESYIALVRGLVAGDLASPPFFES